MNKVSVRVADMYGVSILAFFINSSETLKFFALLQDAFCKNIARQIDLIAEVF